MAQGLGFNRLHTGEPRRSRLSFCFSLCTDSRSSSCICKVDCSVDVTAMAAAGAVGAADRMDVYGHAIGLGGGFEALLGFAEGAIDAGHGHEGPVYVAACR